MLSDAHFQFQDQPITAKKLHAKAASEDGVIWDQPAGTVRENLLLACNAYMVSGGRLYNGVTECGLTQIIEGDDGCVYLHKIPTQYACPSYIKCERGENDTLIIRQQLIDNFDDQYFVYLTRMVLNEESENTTYEESDQPLKFIYKDGVLSPTDELKDGKVIMGCLQGNDTDGYRWNGFGDWNFSIRPINQEMVQLPEDAKLETMFLKYTIEDERENYEEWKVAFVGNDVYINIYKDRYIKGTLDTSNNKITFKRGQYLGTYVTSDTGSHLFFTPAKVSITTVEGTGAQEIDMQVVDEIVFDYDPATRAFASEGYALTVNTQINILYYVRIYWNPRFSFVSEKVAIPADPELIAWNATLDEFGHNSMQFKHPAVDNNGEPLNTEKLSYMCYIDNEPFEFTTEEYPVLSANTYEIPYGYKDGRYGFHTDFAYNYSVFEVLFDPASNIGIQSIYRGGNQEMRSNIVYFDLKKKINNWDNTYETFTVKWENGDTDGIQKLTTQKAVGTGIYDLQGRRLTGTPVQKGIYVVNGRKTVVK